MSMVKRKRDRQPAMRRGPGECRDGCKTTEVGSALLGQVAALEHPTLETATDDQIATLVTKATAMVAELEPTTAEGLLATRMVGAHRLAMAFLGRGMGIRPAGTRAQSDGLGACDCVIAQSSRMRESIGVRSARGV
jgi:hypothetical protein